MNIFNEIKSFIERKIQEMAVAGLVPQGLDLSRITAEPPRDPAHGDVATNAAMVLAKPTGQKPRELAERIAEALRDNDEFASVEIAGPGFINIRLDMSVWPKQLATILRAGTSYGDSALGAGQKVNVEFVSANPTGLLHVGHARGAVVGDALASLLHKAGFEVTREYYINDAGKQVEILGESFLKRLAQLRGESVSEAAFEGLYPGEEVIAAAEAAIDSGTVKSVDEAPDDAIRLREASRLAVAYMMRRIEEDLEAMGIRFDRFSSERALVEAGSVDEVLRTLDHRGLIYTGVLEPPKGKLPDDWEERPQTLFRASEFGDDVDRPLKKSDGSWTYFASDIAYHLDKFNRGYRVMIDVWGADHGGYVKRMQAAVSAVTEGQGSLDVKLCQLVNLFDRGEPVRMSKRAGTVVTVRDVLDKVGRDVVRFIMLTRKNDATLDFDFAKVTEQSKDNPVFYVQYAHARAHSVFRQAGEALPELSLDDESLVNAATDRLTDSGEISLIKQLTNWPRIVESSAEAHEPHRLAFYLHDTASMFHAQWNRGKDDPTLRFIVEEDAELTLARLALVRGVQAVIASGLQVMGVEPVREMR